MNNIESTILKMINLLKIVEPTLKKEGRSIMVVESLGFKKSSKNKKMK